MSGTENNTPPPKRSKRRWFAWLLLGVLGGEVVQYNQPRTYRGSTSLLIIPQRVPERFVQPTVTADLGERLNMIQQQILSRTRLERIIQEFKLYEAERRRFIMEDVVERMRRDIQVTIARPRNDDSTVNSFSVSFDSSDPRTAMRVTERFGSLFVQENVEDRALLADQTDQFLKGELEDLRRRLVEIEARLAAKGRKAVPSWQTAQHDVLVATYKQLLEKSEAATMSMNLERRQIGEQFKIIDGARLPERPISPRLFPYLALGALTGLGAGIIFSIASFVWRRGRPRPAAA